MSDLQGDSTNGSDPQSEGAVPMSADAKPLVWQSLSEFEALSEFEGRLGDGDTRDDAAAPGVADFIGREFPTDDFDELGDVDRRRFMQILGASAALAGASSCRWEKEQILPHTRRPEETVPGKPKYYASVMDLAGAARPVTVTSYDGRPIKIEPNERLAPGTDVYSQADVLGFWDPDRSRYVARVSGDGTFESASWSDAIDALRSGLDGGSFAVLASTHSSPTLERLREEFAARGVRWVQWAPTSQDSTIEGTRLAFGEPLRPHYSLDNADVVVALDALSLIHI